MDVTFVLDSGESFSIEVGFFDSFLEVKEKVQKYHDIPVSKQSLFFHGQLLQDEGTVLESDLCQNSRIHLKVTADPINLQVKILGSSTTFPLEINLDDTILQLKEKIHDKWKFITVDAMGLQFSISSGNELLDHQSLRECELNPNNSKVYVLNKKQPAPSPSPTKTPAGTSRGGGRSGRPKKLNVMVLPMPRRGTDKIAIEVMDSGKVKELRKVLEEFHGSVLPENREYFFIHEQYVMDEYQSFQYHHVKDGDTIELFDGSVEEKPFENTRRRSR